MSCPCSPVRIPSSSRAPLARAPPGRRALEEIPSHRIEVPDEAGTIVAVGGGSAIDTAKAASAASGCRLFLPTTYSGAEMDTCFGVRDPDRLMRGGVGSASDRDRVRARLTLGLPRAETVGTALNALAHCAEAPYVRERTPQSDHDALDGADLIGPGRLPRVVDAPGDLEWRATASCTEPPRRRRARRLDARTRPRVCPGPWWAPRHPTRRADALTLPPALRFNQEVAGAPDLLRRGARRGRSHSPRRGARPPRRLRTAARPRRPGGRAGRGRRERRRPPRRQGESTAGPRRPTSRQSAALDRGDPVHPTRATRVAALRRMGREDVALPLPLSPGPASSTGSARGAAPGPRGSTAVCGSDSASVSVGFPAGAAVDPHGDADRGPSSAGAEHAAAEHCVTALPLRLTTLSDEPMRPSEPRARPARRPLLRLHETIPKAVRARRPPPW